MRILVISDSHGRYSGIEAAVQTHPEASHLIFLGDGANEMEEIASFYPQLTCHILAGNCDFRSERPSAELITLSGIRILACHGHTYYVKSGLETALNAAQRQKARVLLYGHTHCAYESYRDGVYIMNPGSIASPRSGSQRTYGLLDITDQGIMTAIARI